MRKNRYVSRQKLKQLQRDRKARMMESIEDRKRRQLNASLYLRYVGLVLVQGSSALALMGYPLMVYWCALWLGLLHYQITAIMFYQEDNRVYKMTKTKFENHLGSSRSTVQALKVKRNREIVYIIGNTVGLILIGANIITSL